MDTEAFLKEQIITTEEATDILALSKQRISQLAASGDLPFLKHISSGFLFLKQDVQEYKRIRSGSAIVWNGTNGCGWLPITERKKLFVDCIDAHGHPVAIELYATSMDAIARFRIPHRDIRPGAQNYTDTKPTCVIEFQDGHTLLADFCSLHTLEKHPFMVSFIQEITGMQVIFSEMKKNRFYTATYDAEAYLPGWRWVDHPSRFPVSATTPFHDGYFFTFQSDGKTIHAVQKAFAKFDYRVDIVIDQLSGLLETILMVEVINIEQQDNSQQYLRMKGLNGNQVWLHCLNPDAKKFQGLGASLSDVLVRAGFIEEYLPTDGFQWIFEKSISVVGAS